MNTNANISKLNLTFTRFEEKQFITKTVEKTRICFKKTLESLEKSSVILKTTQNVKFSEDEKSITEQINGRKIGAQTRCVNIERLEKSVKLSRDRDQLNKEERFKREKIFT